MDSHYFPPEAGITQPPEAAGLSRQRVKQTLDTGRRSNATSIASMYPTGLAMQALLAFSDAGKLTSRPLNGYGSSKTRNDHMQALAAARARKKYARAN